MRPRRVLLCLPEQSSEELLAIARAVKASLAQQFQVRLQIEGETLDEDDELTPVDNPLEQPVVIRISDDEERT
jgi:hypothetical protein